MRLIAPDQNSLATTDRLNADLSDEYLENRRNPRWVAKPTVAYLWARTVTCKNCRATIPLLKTCWLCRKGNKRIRLLIEPNDGRTGVALPIEHNVPERGGNAAQKREHDKRIGAGTMSKAGAQCPCCPTIIKQEDIRYEGRNGRLGNLMTAVVIDAPHGKEYRLPTEHERQAATILEPVIRDVFERVPFGLPEELVPAGASRKGGGSASPLFHLGWINGESFSRTVSLSGTVCCHCL